MVHASQTRKGTAIPYISHLIGVASFVLEHGADEDTAVAALLHDAPEDQGGYAMLAQIKARFGVRVEKIVQGCTDTFEDPKAAWPKRKEDYIAHLEREADAATCLVSVADKLHNARAILHDLRNVGVAVFDRFSVSQERTGWYYGNIVRIFHQRLANEEAEALATALGHAIGEMPSTKDATRSATEPIVGCAASAAHPTQGRRTDADVSVRRLIPRASTPVGLVQSSHVAI